MKTAVKTILSETQEFKKGKVYGVDAMEIVKKDIFPDYFDLDFDESINDYEQGSALCKKSFKITIYISE